MGKRAEGGKSVDKLCELSKAESTAALVFALVFN
jgi:hypothetical protein